MRELSQQIDLDEADDVIADLPDVSVASLVRTQRRGPLASRRTLIVAASAVALLAGVLLLLFILPPPGANDASRESVATITGTADAEWGNVDRRQGQRLGITTLRLKAGRAEMRFHSGAQVGLTGPATFGLESDSTASLFEGKLWARLDEPSEPFVVQARGVRVLDRGTEFGVEILSGGETEVHCLDGAIETQARARRPRFYWSFDQPADELIEQSSGQIARVGPGAARVEGLIGSGAMEFDNSSGAYVNVGNGGGTQIGAGRFGVGSGLTIEALTVVRWSGDGASNGKTSDYDEIFRKEDGTRRMLLSFQNDDYNRARNVPPLAGLGPTLSFGLHLEGDGYSELEAMLDGRGGRPSLKSLRDGRPHHIAATYDAWTGAKSLYIDGVLVQQAHFPAGTLIVSGGPTDAIIGNTAGGSEAYTGVIDEVAIYDLALTPQEVAGHLRNVQRGVNYFGAASSNEMRGSDWNVTAKLTAGQAMRFNTSSGLPLDKVPVDYQRFRGP